MLAEILAFVSHPARLRRLAQRAEAVALAEEGADFLDVYHHFAGQGCEARDAYRRAVAKDPAYRTPYRHAGLAYYRESRYADAEREYERARATDPEDAYAYFGAALLAMARREWKEAETLLRHAITLDSQGAVALHIGARL